MHVVKDVATPLFHESFELSSGVYVHGAQLSVAQVGSDVFIERLDADS